MKLTHSINSWWRQHKLRHIEVEIECLREEIAQLHDHLNHLIQQKCRIEVQEYQQRNCAMIGE